MNSPDAIQGAAPARGQVFRYEGFAADAERGLLTCRYSLDGREFAERVTLVPGPGWDTPAARAAARIVYLLAGVSYYKTAAPPVIDLGDTALTGRERAFLREFYLSGLGEYAYRNGLDLSDLRIEAPVARGRRRAVRDPARRTASLRPLIPFGGGIDSIVTVEGVRAKRTGDIALFVVSRPGDRFAAIEQPAAVSGLPVIRAGREIDPQLLRSPRTRLPERARAGDRHHLRDRRPRGGAQRQDGGRDVQRVVGLGADARARRQAGQPPVVQVGRLRGELPRAAPGRSRGPARLLLGAPRPDRAVGGGAVRRADPVPQHVPQL